MKKKRASAFILALAISLAFLAPAGAETLSVPFSDDSNIESSGLVLNSALGYAHPPLKSDDWDDNLVGPLQSEAFGVGDGRHGSFTTEADYLRFHEGAYAGDNTIRINTDTYPDLQFTAFELLSPYVLLPTGSQPLKIRSLSYIRVRGTINCSGEPGTDQQSTVSTTVPAGGAGRCGGGTGGTGGSMATLIGQPGALTSSGEGNFGLAGPAIGDGGGGGGGMSQTAPANVGDGRTFGGAFAGNRGENEQDDSFRLVGGGAGGGGGSAYNAGGNSTGAGGGGGGGSIYLYAVDTVNVYAGGTITANGGNGGGALTLGNGGGGGGGGGGSILIYSRGNIDFLGPVTATGGSAGPSDGGDGGVGGGGRTWIIDNDGVAANMAESPVTLLPFVGIVNYQTSTYTIVTNQFDLANTDPVLLSAAVDATIPAGSSVSLEIATSDTPFSSADAVWVSSSSLTSASGGRYARLRLLVTSADESNPVLVREATLTYQLTDKNQFDFAASCGRITAPPRPPAGTLLLFLLPLIAGLALRMRLAFTSNEVTFPHASCDDEGSRVS